MVHKEPFICHYYVSTFEGFIGLELTSFPSKFCKKKTLFMSTSSIIRRVLIDVEYKNCGRNLDVYLLLVILLGIIKSKLNYRLVTYKLASP